MSLAVHMHDIISDLYWLVRLHSPDPNPVEGYEQNTIAKLIAML